MRFFISVLLLVACIASADKVYASVRTNGLRPSSIVIPIVETVGDSFSEVMRHF